MADGMTQRSSEGAALLLAQRLVIAIPTLNEAAHITDCLDSLRQGVSPEIFAAMEIIIADGGSKDNTRKIVEDYSAAHPNVRWIDNPEKFQSAGVNHAAQAAANTRDILLRCDAHAVYPQGFILKALTSWAEREADSVVFPMDAEGQGCFQKANAWIVDTKLGSGGSAHRGGHQSGYVDHGHHGVFDKNRFLALGGYDASFSHNEDAEFDARLRQDGGKIWLDADIRIGYFPRSNPVSLWRQYFGYGKGRARNVLKNRETPRLRQMIPVVNIFALAGSFLLSPLHPVFLFWPALYAGLLVGASLWMAVKHKSLCGLWSGVALADMHLAWGLGFISGIFQFIFSGTKPARQGRG